MPQYKEENLAQIIKQLQQQGIELVHVVAFDNKHCIGKDNQLAWHIPEDLKHFKSITQYGTVIMGRKTFVSMGKALPHRNNWVITRDQHWNAENVSIAHSLSDAILNAGTTLLNQPVHSDERHQQQSRTLYIIGGGEIFAQSIHYMNRLEITVIDLDVQGDAFYPAVPSHFSLIQQQSGISEKEQIGYTFQSYQSQINHIDL